MLLLVFDVCFLSTRQELGWQEHLSNGLFCVGQFVAECFCIVKEPLIGSCCLLFLHLADEYVQCIQIQIQIQIFIACCAFA